MRPDDNDPKRMGTPLVPQRSYVHTPPSTRRDDAAQAAAANIVRDQLTHIYSGNTTTPTPQTTPVASEPSPETTTQHQDLQYTSPYDRTQKNTAEIQAEQWKKYHSAWQDYYQKYYERYYVSQVHKEKQALQEKLAQQSSVTPDTHSPQSQSTSVSQDEALYDLRSKLRQKIHESATKVRKSRHFVPIAAAACVVLLFLFLQYNRVLFANVQAYISPGNFDPTNIIIDPTAELSIGPEPKLLIPKINVDVPVDYTATPDNASQMQAMNFGVAYFGIPGANSKPGQIGNTVISGHSSNDITDPGDYKFIFARLDALSTGDTIYLNYEGKRYVYSVTKKEVVKPTQVDKLIYETDKPVLTLITCTPLGTSLNRLLVTAEQVSPSPSEATPAPDTTPASQSAAMPGNSPTFLQRILGNS